MAGKADLVNSLVDSVDGAATTATKFPHYDGWGAAAEAEGDWGYASLLDTPPPDGSQRIGPSGGGGTQG